MIAQSYKFNLGRTIKLIHFNIVAVFKNKGELSLLLTVIVSQVWHTKSFFSTLSLHFKDQKHSAMN